VQRIYQLRQRPKPKRLIKIGEAWRPYRSIACWYLWESLKKSEVRRQKSEVGGLKSEKRAKKR
jgi:3-methyladenine DNA glycosylase/8-oxoguanine DNA glycosylase